MNSTAKEQLLKLTVSERVQLVQDIWDTIAEVPEELKLSDEEKSELDLRLDRYEADPHSGATWEVVRNRVQNRK